MSHQIKSCTTKIITAAIIVGMLALLAFIVPEHLAELASHDDCAICRIIKHVPLLEPEAVTDIASLLQVDRLPFISYYTASPGPQSKNRLSRAPPLF